MFNIASTSVPTGPLSSALVHQAVAYCWCWQKPWGVQWTRIIPTGRERTHQHVYPSATTFTGWETVTTISLLVPMGTRAFTGSRAPQVHWICEGASHYVIVTGACCCPNDGEPYLARVNDFYRLRAISPFVRMLSRRIVNFIDRYGVQLYLTRAIV